MLKSTQKSRDNKKSHPGMFLQKTNHSTVECKSVNMAARNVLILIFLIALVRLTNGFKIRERQELTPEDCLKPPMTGRGHECCRLPKERIWGDLQNSFQMCLKKIKQRGGTHLRQVVGEGLEMVTPTPEMSPMEGEAPSTPSTTPGTQDHNGMPRWSKRLSEKLKNLLSTVYKEIKSTIDSLWQSVIIITDHHARLSNDSCFMECIFEDQGFLLDKVVNKVALLERLALTLVGNEPWRIAATEAVETCFETEMMTPSNGTCNSKSEEVFRCVFKQLFFNCPNWMADDYCTSVREFYQKCPNGPPPEIYDNHSTTAAPTEDVAVTPSTESETASEPA